VFGSPGTVVSASPGTWALLVTCIGLSLVGSTRGRGIGDDGKGHPVPETARPADPGAVAAGRVGWSLPRRLDGARLPRRRPGAISLRRRRDARAVRGRGDPRHGACPRDDRGRRAPVVCATDEGRWIGVRLQRLKLRNFKGIREFTLEANGSDVTIYGDNGAGKTSLVDAFMWLLFDKDSQNRKDFQIKTLDADGEPIHNLEHEVEAALELDDGRQVTLRKVYKEKWTRKRGSAVAEFTGHTVDHYIDGVPTKQSDYD